MTENTDAPKDTARMKAIFAFVACLAFAASPLVTGGFAGYAPEQFPIPQIEPPIQPAGWAFSIWGLIYLWLIASAGYGMFRKADDLGWDATRWPLIGAAVLGAAWIPTARADPITATIMIWAMLGFALWAYAVAPDTDRLWLRGPLGLFAGWLTAAASVSVGLVGAGYGFLSNELIAAYFGLAIALAVAAAVLLVTAPALAFGAALAWALAGITVANLGGFVGLSMASGGAAFVILILSAKSWR
ncbi:MAG: hypothetical protein AAFX00_08790 [Pseudomonadota bacterium]